MQWSRFNPIFSLNRKNIRKLLQSVRDIRNNLAHFRGTASTQQHDTLLACKEWLERHKTLPILHFLSLSCIVVFQKALNNLPLKRVSTFVRRWKKPL
jgi:hypothetical protein